MEAVNCPYKDTALDSLKLPLLPFEIEIHLQFTVLVV